MGGCVRDALLGRPVHDYDLTVNVPPDSTKAAFAGYPVIETGLKHGTVTVVLEGHNVEITSFRTEGAYSDLRRPDSVRFTPSLAEDLSRRDFTVNAMAYSPASGLTDLFGGQADLKAKLLRCVGEPDRRFNEDALRILRALRFAAVLGFAVESATARSLLKNKENLSAVSAERIFAELKALLRGEWAEGVLRSYAPVFQVCVPALGELSPAGYAAAAARAGALRDETLSFAALICGLGETAADRICRDLKTDNKFRSAVRFLTANRDVRFSSPGQARRFFGAQGEARCRMLLRFQAAWGGADPVLAAVCGERGAFPTRLSELRVTGTDLIPLGFTGKGVGDTLSALLEQAAAGALPNEKTALLRAAETMKKTNEET